MSLIHRIEDVQFLCFMLVFGIMALQSRKDRTILYVWFSYVLASLVALVDVLVAQPLPLFANSFILALLTWRYAVLAVGIASFVGKARWLASLCSVLVGGALCLLVLAWAGYPRQLVMPLHFLLVAVQLVAIAVILARSEEMSTRLPRWLLCVLFLLSAAYRVNQMMFVLSSKTPHDVWLRDQGLFLNSTILGCLLPFTIVWMMNARAHAVLLEQSILDPLTNLLNRRGLSVAADHELRRYGRDRKDFAVAVVDIDHFKALNDTHGHSFGDEVLVKTADLLRAELRQTDIVARTGGEEFVVLLPFTNSEDMVPVLERVRSLLEQLELAQDGEPSVSITISIGVTNSNGRSVLHWAYLQKEADAALYEAKHTGRNRIVVAVSGTR